jgi:GAF domain-containing protein
MASEASLIKKLTALNEIAETLNRSVDVKTALHDSLVRIIELVGLETGWIYLKDPSARNRWAGPS